MHGEVVVNKGDVPCLPGNIKGEAVCPFSSPFYIVRIDRGSIAEGDGLLRVVSIVFPALEGSNQLVEENDSSIPRLPDGGDHPLGTFGRDELEFTDDDLPRTVDEPLTETGLRQARLVGERLARTR